MLNFVEIKKLDQRIGEEFSEPSFATDGSAAIDLVACLNEPVTILPGDRLLIGTGVAIFINDPRYAGVLAPRSGNGHKKGMILSNTIGVFDADYQGEVLASIFNRSKEAFVIEPGDKIAQMLFLPIERPTLKWVDEFSDKTARGAGGFGSTGQ